MYRAGGYEFNSKDALLAELSRGLKDQAGNERLDDNRLVAILTHLAGLHPNAGTKFDSGIDYWIVMPNNDLGRNTMGYRAVLMKGGEPEKFGYSKIVKPKDKSYFVAEALTEEAIEITRKFRRDRFAAGPVHCADTSELIADIKQAEAVHRRPVRGLLHEQFLHSQGLTYNDVEVVPSKPAGRRLVDRGLAERWRVYQLAHLDGMVIVKSKRV